MRTKGMLVGAIISSILIVLVLGGVLYQISPFFRQHIFCPLCGASDTAAAPDLYIVSHRNPSTFASETFLYTIDGRMGSVKHATDLGQMGRTSYQEVLNGISYQLFSNGVGSAPGTNDILSAVRLSDGKTLWSDTFEPGAQVETASSTTLYVVSSNTHTTYDLTAVSRKSGHSLWVYEPQTNPQITLDNDTLFVQESGGTTGFHEQLYALNAESGHTIWNHVLNELQNLTPIPIVVNDGHVFFASQPYTYEQATIVEYDEKMGNLLWRKQFSIGKVITALHSENHALLIETTDAFLTKNQTVSYRPIHTLSVLRDTDKSLLWSYTLQPSNATAPDQRQGFQWIYSNNIVYSLSPSVDPQTFAEVLGMSAWNISDGKRLFQTNLDLSGGEDLNVIHLHNQLVFTSRNNSLGGPVHNDIEVRQAQTGALLWHKHFGQAPAQNYAGALDLYISDVANLNIGVYGDIPDALPLNGEPNQAILYLSLLQDNPSMRTLYALNMQRGALLWQVDTDTLDIDPQLHGLVHEVTMAGAHYSITEFPTPNPTSGPLAITRGPDGNMWFTESMFNGASEDGIGRITPRGTITEFPLSNSNNAPYGITSGSDGNLWFTEGINYGGGSQSPSSGKIGRITPNGKITEFPLPGTNSSPQGITSGPDGNLWFTKSQLTSGMLQGGIGRITPAGSITVFPLAENSFPGEITSGSDGNLWFTESVANGLTDQHSAIGRITPGGKITLFPLSNAQTDLRMITRGPDGNVWFTASAAGHGTVVRITPSGSTTQFLIPHSNTFSSGGGAPYGIQLGPVAITSGPDGNLWFTNLSQSGQIERLTPSGAITAFSLPSTYSYGIISGPDDNLWFTETGPNQVGRIAFGK